MGASLVQLALEVAKGVGLFMGWVAIIDSDTTNQRRFYDELEM